MTDTIEHTIKLSVPPRSWDKTRATLRELRTVLRDAGGFSSVTKRGSEVTLQVKGPTCTVLDIVDKVGKILRPLADDEHRRKDPAGHFLLDHYEKGGHKNPVLDKIFRDLKTDLER